MNFVLWTGISSLLGIASLYLFYKVFWFKNVPLVTISVLLSLSLSVVVNLFIKKPIIVSLYSLWEVKSITEINSLWLFVTVLFIPPVTEELIKILPCLPFIMKVRRPNERSFSLGFFTGIGFGIGEAWYLAYCFTKKMPSLALGGFWQLVGFGWERFLAILIHGCLTSLVLYGLFQNKFLRYFLLAVIFHAFINLSALLYQQQQAISYIQILILLAGMYLLFYTVFKVDSTIRRKFILDNENKKGEVLYERKEEEPFDGNTI